MYPRLVMHRVFILSGLTFMVIAVMADPSKAGPLQRICFGTFGLACFAGGVCRAVARDRSAQALRRAVTGLGQMWRAVICHLRGHDLEPEVLQLKVVELPKELPQGPPTTAYRQLAVDDRPNLALVGSKQRRCSRCHRTTSSPAKLV